MIKRPLNPQFTQAVLTGRKITTIRAKVWPINVPIMLYNWSGAPYRSKHVDVTPIKVLGYWPISIIHCDNGTMVYSVGMENERALWETEGFDSAEKMDEWFRSLVRKNETVIKVLMRFRLLNDKSTNAEGNGGRL